MQTTDEMPEADFRALTMHRKATPPAPRRIAVSDHRAVMTALTERGYDEPASPLGTPRSRKVARRQAAATAKTIVKARRRARLHDAAAQVAALPDDLRNREYSRDDLAAAADALPADALLADVLAEAARIADTRNAAQERVAVLAHQLDKHRAWSDVLAERACTCQPAPDDRHDIAVCAKEECPPGSHQCDLDTGKCRRCRFQIDMTGITDEVPA
jgi:hypothetical protein